MITPAISCCIYLPLPIEMILSVSYHPRWPRQVQSHVAVTDSFVNKCCQCKWSTSYEEKKLYNIGPRTRTRCTRWKPVDLRPTVRIVWKLFAIFIRVPSCCCWPCSNHRHLRNIDCLSFVMCLLLALVLIVIRLLFFCCSHLQNYLSKQGRQNAPLSGLYYLDVYGSNLWTHN